MSDQHLLGIRLQMEALISSREGMLALNKERESHGYALAYSEEAFDNLRKSFEELIAQL